MNCENYIIKLNTSAQYQLESPKNEEEIKNTRKVLTGEIIGKIVLEQSIVNENKKVLKFQKCHTDEIIEGCTLFDLRSPYAYASDVGRRDKNSKQRWKNVILSQKYWLLESPLETLKTKLIADDDKRYYPGLFRLKSSEFFQSFDNRYAAFYTRPELALENCLACIYRKMEFEVDDKKIEFKNVPLPITRYIFVRDELLGLLYGPYRWIYSSGKLMLELQSNGRGSLVREYLTSVPLFKLKLGENEYELASFYGANIKECAPEPENIFDSETIASKLKPGTFGNLIELLNKDTKKKKTNTGFRSIGVLNPSGGLIKVADTKFERSVTTLKDSNTIEKTKEVAEYSTQKRAKPELDPRLDGDLLNELEKIADSCLEPELEEEKSSASVETSQNKPTMSDDLDSPAEIARILKPAPNVNVALKLDFQVKKEEFVSEISENASVQTVKTTSQTLIASKMAHKTDAPLPKENDKETLSSTAANRPSAVIETCHIVQISTDKRALSTQKPQPIYDSRKLNKQNEKTFNSCSKNEISAPNETNHQNDSISKPADTTQSLDTLVLNTLASEEKNQPLETLVMHTLQETDHAQVAAPAVAQPCAHEDKISAVQSDKSAVSWKIPEDTFKEDVQTLVNHVYTTMHSEFATFSRTDAANIVLCIAQNLLTILVGRPGCGKTNFVKLLARSLGLTHPEFNRFHEVHVGFDWRSERDLLGYYNPVNGRFEGTSLYRSLKEYEHCEENSHYPYWVLLDDANMSPLEGYLSVFRGIQNDELFLGKSYHLDIGEKNEGIEIPSSLRWIATFGDDYSKYYNMQMIHRAWVVSLPEASDWISIFGSKHCENKDCLIVPQKVLNTLSIICASELGTDEECGICGLCYDIYCNILDIIKTLDIKLQIGTWNAIRRYCYAAKKLHLMENELASENNTILDYVISQRVLPMVHKNGKKIRASLKMVQDKYGSLLPKTSDIITDILNRGDVMFFYSFFDRQS